MDFSRRLIANRPSVIYDVQGGETVIIDLSIGHYFRLEQSGSTLWERFAEGTSIAELIDTCRNDEALRPRLEAIVDELIEHGLLRDAAEDETGDGLALAAEWEFAGFELEQFTDLEDILGLDPIHEVDPIKGWPHAREP